MVGADGVARVLDFGVAKAFGRLQTTREGQIKGKASYMAPEQLRGEPIDRRVDLYAMSIVLWEVLTSTRLFNGDSPEATMTQVLEKDVPPPSRLAPHVSPALDDVVMRGLSRRKEERFATARAMVTALEGVIVPATPRETGDWIASVAEASLRERARRVELVDSGVDSMPATSQSMPATPSETIPMARWPVLRRRAVLVTGASMLVGTTLALALRGHPRTTEGRTAASEQALRESAASSAALDTAASTPSSDSTPFPVARASTSAPGPAKPSRRAPLRAMSTCEPPYEIDARGVKIPKRGCI
jgi:serine/threonine-protein kinase